MGTCFQVSPDLIATAWHVLDGLEAGSPGCQVTYDSLGNAAFAAQSAVVKRVDELSDLAVLEAPQALGQSVGKYGPTDAEPLDGGVSVTGVSEFDDPGHVYRFIDASGSWAGGTTRDDQLPLGRMRCRDIVRGMSGAPVRRRSDNTIVGVVSGRYNSADGWLRDSVWVARSEQLEALCDGMATLTMDGEAATAAVELVLEIGEHDVRLHGAGIEVSTPHAGVRPGLADAVDEVRRVRGRLESRSPDPAVDAAAAGTDASLERVSRLMAESFLPKPISEKLGEVLEHATRGHQAVHLGIDCEGILSRLPWEALPDPRDGTPLVLSSLASIYRRRSSPPPPAVAGPLQILVAISSPDTDDVMLDYEKELKNMLAAVRTARQGNALVRIVPFATTGAIRAALESGPAHVLHLSGHGDPGRFTFEEVDGKARELGPDEFVNEAIPAGRMPAVVALSSCHSNVAKSTGELSFAARLLERGASVVIATETSVTDTYATRVFSRTYGQIANATIPDIVGAVCDARRAVQAELENAPDERERRLGSLNEWSALSVLSSSGAVPVFDSTVQGPAPPPPTRFTIGSVASRATGDFVGRRREQRQWPTELLSGPHAGLVLHGIGGVGKTTLAAELAGRILEREPDRAHVVLINELTVDGLLNSVIAALRQQAIVRGQMQGVIAEALKAAALGELPWSERLAILRDNVLGALPLLVVIDNFEDNLSRSGATSTISDPALAELLANWVKEPGMSRLLITCRYPFELPESLASRLDFKPVGPLSAAETAKLVWSLPSLDRLQPHEIEHVWRLLGGHPRSLEYLEALLSQGAMLYPDITERLSHVVSKRLGDRGASTLLSTEWNLDDAIAEVATIAADDVLLEQLTQALEETPGANSLLLGASVYRAPVDINALLFQVGKSTEQKTESGRKGAMEQLEAILKEAGLDLIDGALELENLPPEILAKLAPHLEVMKTPPKPDLIAPEKLDQAIQACVNSSLLSRISVQGNSRFFVHRWTASELERLVKKSGDPDAMAAFHQKAGLYWTWRASNWPQGPKARVHDLLEARHHFLAANQLDRALFVTHQACPQLHSWGAWDDEATLIRDTLKHLAGQEDPGARWLSQLGTISFARGDFEEAERLFREALTIDERLDSQSGMASNFHKLGILAEQRGESEEAKRLYGRSLEITEEQGDLAGVAACYHQLGILAHHGGNLDEAEAFYKRSLNLKKEIGDTIAAASGYHQLGMVAQQRGEVDEAEKLYRHSLEIHKRLQNKSHIASGYHQLGILAQHRGDLSEAEKLYRSSLEIEEKLGNLAGMASSYHQLGMVAEAAEDFDAAEDLYRRSLEIEKRLQNQPGIASSYGQLGILAERRGDLEEAERLYNRSLEINQKAKNLVGMAVALSQLGILKTTHNVIEESIGLHGQALMLRLRAAPGEADVDLHHLNSHRKAIGEDAFWRALSAGIGQTQSATVLKVLNELSEGTAAANDGPDGG